MSGEQPSVGSLASVNPNKTFPVDVTSPDSVRGLILIGSSVLFIVCWVVVACTIYCLFGRKAPLIFPNGADDDKDLIVSIESGEKRDSDDVQKIKVVTTANSSVDVSTRSTSRCSESSSRLSQPASTKEPAHRRVQILRTESDSHNQVQCSHLKPTATNVGAQPIDVAKIHSVRL